MAIVISDAILFEIYSKQVEKGELNKNFYFVGKSGIKAKLLKSEDKIKCIKPQVQQGSLNEFFFLSLPSYSKFNKHESCCVYKLAGSTHAE